MRIIYNVPICDCFYDDDGDRVYCDECIFDDEED